MASTITISRSIAYASQFVRLAPLTFNITGDPSFSNADWVRQFLLAPPFAWRWNRTETQFTCTAGVSDYTQSLPNFGYIEKAVLVDTTNGDISHELEVVLDLAQETVPNLSTKIAAQLDDGAGNITFRLLPPPAANYMVTVTSQNAPGVFTDAGQTWTPIPDYLSYLYNQGMLAKTYEYIADPRFAGTMSLFLRQAVAANEGLDDTAVNIFLADSIVTERTQSAVQGAAMGRQARGGFQ